MALRTPDRPTPRVSTSWRQRRLLHAGSITLFRVLGIAIEFHVTFLLIFVWGGWLGWVRAGDAGGIFQGVIAVSLLFGAVLIHELAHVIHARAVGWDVRGVTLMPVGGVAEIAAQPGEPFHQLTTALAGPAANLGIALLVGAAAYFVHPFDPLQWDLYLLARFPSIHSILLYLLAINGLLFLTNMVPVYPMDGARLLQAGLVLTGTSNRLATRFVAILGWAAALALLLAGALTAHAGAVGMALLYVLLASVVYFSSQSELSQLLRHRALTQLRVGQMEIDDAVTVAPDTSLVQLTSQRARRGESVIPVVMSDRLMGLLLLENAHHIARQSPRATVTHAMRPNFPVLAPEDTLISALAQMERSKIPSLPIESEGKFFGMLSLAAIEYTLKRLDHRPK